MIKILSKTPQHSFYKLSHPECCTFIASRDEFKIVSSPKNEMYADMICPVCGKQFYSDYIPCDEQGCEVI